MGNYFNNRYGIFVYFDDEILVKNPYGYIYMIQNNINSKVYIGQTLNYKRRLSEHFRDAKNNKFSPLCNALNKYGLTNFTYLIIDTCLNDEDLNQKEIFYIQHYESNNKKIGYNIEYGGNCSKPTLETLMKMSNSHIGIKQSEEWKSKRIHKAGSVDAKKYGKAKTDEEKKRLSQNSSKFWQNKNRSEETKLRISKTKKERGLSEKQKEIICKKVYKIDLNSNKILEIFDSTADAAKSLNVNQSTISRWCRNNKPHNNFIWNYGQ